MCLLPSLAVERVGSDSVSSDTHTQPAARNTPRGSCVLRATHRAAGRSGPPPPGGARLEGSGYLQQRSGRTAGCASRSGPAGCARPCCVSGWRQVARVRQASKAGYRLSKATTTVPRGRGVLSAQALSDTDHRRRLHTRVNYCDGRSSVRHPSRSLAAGSVSDAGAPGGASCSVRLTHSGAGAVLR